MKNAATPFLVGLVTAVAAVGGLYILIGALFYAPGGGEYTAPGMAEAEVVPQNISANATTTPVATAPAERPSKLVIPSIGVSAPVDQVGETAGGAIGTPRNLTDVAWFNESVLPGEEGTSIIDGHVNNGLGLAGVFNKLEKIQAGADVSVTMSDGTVLHFTVTRVDAYPYDNVPVGELLADTGTPTLRLITCEGQWIGSQKTYNERLVVTAVLE